MFQTENQLKEFGDKIPAEKKTAIESALTELKAAHASKDLQKIATALTAMNAAWSAASEDMYKAGQAQQQAGDQQGQAGGEQKSGSNTENVTDVDFEEVK